MPDSEMVWGEPAAESTIETAAVSGPTIDGVNETEIVQLPPDGTVAGQVFETPKSDEFGPVAPMLVIVRNEVPESVSVIVCAALFVVIVCAGNEIEELFSETCGFAPFPPPVSCVQLLTLVQAYRF